MHGELDYLALPVFTSPLVFLIVARINRLRVCPPAENMLLERIRKSFLAPPPPPAPSILLFNTRVCSVSYNANQRRRILVYSQDIFQSLERT